MTNNKMTIFCESNNFMVARLAKFVKIDGMAAAIPDMPRENMHLYHVDRHEDAVDFFRRHELIA